MLLNANVCFVRQVCLEIATCLTSFTLGIVFAFPSVLNTAFSPDADIKATSDQASWIASCLGIGGFLGFVFIPIVFEIFGRKTANIVTNIFLFIGSLILYVATDVFSIAFARLAQGMAIGGTLMSVIGLCECISPKRRGYFMVINMVSLVLGSLACHCLGLILIWRHIALFGALWNVISIVLFSMSAESPAFLAMRGEFNKCTEIFAWYRGDSLNAKRELKELISAQMENLRIREDSYNTSVFQRAKNMIMTREFQKSLCILTLATLCLDTCGRPYRLGFIFPELTNNQTLALYISVGTDILLIFVFSISTVLVKHYKRRTLLFKSGFCSVFLMFMVSFSIILRSKFEILQDAPWLTAAVMVFHTFATNIGMVPIIFVLSGEVFSLNQKSFGSVILGIISLISFSAITKLTPFIKVRIGVEGIYALYGCLLFIFLVILRILLPETKDKTLQQIEDEMKGIGRKTGISEIELLKYKVIG